MKTNEISKDQILDSRDINKRAEYLRDELNTFLEAVLEEDTEETREALASWLGCDADDLPTSFAAVNGDFPLKEYQSSDEAQELYELEELISEAEGYGDWHHGEALIREDHWLEYCQQFAEDIGAIQRDASWPNNHIDWEAAADALKADYTEVSFGSTTYFMRS